MSSTDPSKEKPVLARTDSRAVEPIARPERTPPGSGLEEPLRPPPRSRPAPSVSRTEAGAREPVARPEPAPPSTRLEEPVAETQPSIENLGTFGPKDPLIEYLAALLGLGNRTGDYLKGLASWRLVEAKGAGTAGEPDPLLVSLKKITMWGLKDDHQEGPFRVRRNSVDEDPIVEWYRQAVAYLNSLELFKPGAAVEDYRRKSGTYFSRLGAVLKDAASWRGSTLKGLISWRLDGARDEAARDGDSLRGSLQGFVEMKNRAGDYLKGLLTWHVTEPANDESAREPDPLWASLKNLALWRVSLKDLATWRITEESGAAAESATADSAPKAFVELWRQAGDYLKGLATWRVTEAGGKEAGPESLWYFLKSLATWRLPEPSKEAKTSLGLETEPPFNFDVLSSALTRNEVRRP